MLGMGIGTEFEYHTMKDLLVKLQQRLELSDIFVFFYRYLNSVNSQWSCEIIFKRLRLNGISTNVEITNKASFRKHTY